MRRGVATNGIDAPRGLLSTASFRVTTLLDRVSSLFVGRTAIAISRQRNANSNDALRGL